MHITDWKENFISKMITRGRNYWRAGAVKNLVLHGKLGKGNKKGCKKSTDDF